MFNSQEGWIYNYYNYEAMAASDDMKPTRFSYKIKDWLIFLLYVI